MYCVRPAGCHLGRALINVRAEESSSQRYQARLGGYQAQANPAQQQSCVTFYMGLLFYDVPEGHDSICCQV